MNNKNNILYAELGDKIKLKNGSIYEFVKMKRTKFIGKKDGQMYDIPMDMFLEIVEKGEKPKLNNDYKTLRQGELFYINKNDKALLFKFEEIKNGKIVGINPIGNVRTTIDVGLYGGKVSDIK